MGIPQHLLTPPPVCSPNIFQTSVSLCLYVSLLTKFVIFSVLFQPKTANFGAHLSPFPPEIYQGYYFELQFYKQSLKTPLTSVWPEMLPS